MECPLARRAFLKSAGMAIALQIHMENEAQ